MTIDFGNLNIQANRLASEYKPTSRGIEATHGIFIPLNGIKNLNLVNFNLVNKNTNVRGIFDVHCLENIKIHGKCEVTCIGSLFSNRSKLSELISVDISEFDTSAVTNIGYLFSEQHKLRSIKLGDLSSVTIAYSAFFGCHSLTDIDFGDKGMPMLKNLEDMFAECRSIKKLDLSNFKNLLAPYLNNMFFDCHSLEELRIPKLVVGHDIKRMFRKCSALKKIEMPKDETSRVNVEKYLIQEGIRKQVGFM